MLIKELDAVFKTLDGKILKAAVFEEVEKDEMDEKGNIIQKKGTQKQVQKDLTLRAVMTNALLTEQLQACQFCGRSGVSERISGEEKARRCYLSTEIYRAKDEVDIDREDVKLVKEQIGKVYPSLIVGQAWRMLEPVKGKIS